MTNKGDHGEQTRRKDETLAPGALKPNECGDLGIRIDRGGVWYYQDSPIGRKELVKLFSTVLSRDDDGVYWMTTPAEHGTVDVEDVPFIAVEMVVDGRGKDQTIRFRTNVEDWVELDDHHPLRVHHDAATGEPTPYIYIRKGLEARIARSVYYDLVALAVEGKGSAAGNEEDNQDGSTVGVWSKATFFPLGTLAEAD